MHGADSDMLDEVIMAEMNRREMLKMMGGAATAVALTPLMNLTRVLTASLHEDLKPPPTPLGRVAEISAEIRAEPTRKAKLVKGLRRDALITLDGQVEGQAVRANNNIWFKTEGGYAYSSAIQPVQEIENKPEPEKAKEKFWGEITVPFTDARTAANPDLRRAIRFYYTTVYRIVDAKQDAKAQWWYRVTDGWSRGGGLWVLASHIRRITPEEMTPLSPSVTDKRVEVNLKTQTMVAYENGSQVLSTIMCSGAYGFGTPRGTHKVLFKNPTLRMRGGSGANYYDLPGVPFCTFITWSGVAIHGAYWHNDWGRPRSHGCLNVPADVARWYWRWTSPEAPYQPSVFYTPRGSKATVVVVK